MAQTSDIRPIHPSQSLNDGSQPSTSYESDVVKANFSHDGLSFPQYMLAGSIAGMVEHMAMFPVDTVKTRMQMMATTGATTSAMGQVSVIKALSNIMLKEGTIGLYRGIGAIGLGAAPAHAVYFSVYETAKEALGGNQKGQHQPFAHAGAGAIATIASDAVLTPMDVVKQRLQLRRSPYKGITDCVCRMSKEEGMRAFYASYRTTIVMNIPFTAVHFSAYEAVKTALLDVNYVSGDEENFTTHILAGGSAGALASAVTNPFDVVKTRLQCQGICGAKRFKSHSVMNALQTIVKEEGLKVLLRGIRPRVMFHTPAAAISWTTYESAKSFLQKWNSSA